MKRRIDSNGFYVDDETTQEKGLTIIEAPCPVGLFKAKWVGEKWVEGGKPPVDETEELKTKVALLESKLTAIESTPTLKTELIAIKEPIISEPILKG